MDLTSRRGRVVMRIQMARGHRNMIGTAPLEAREVDRPPRMPLDLVLDVGEPVREGHHVLEPPHASRCRFERVESAGSSDLPKGDATTGRGGSERVRPRRTRRPSTTPCSSAAAEGSSPKWSAWASQGCFSERSFASGPMLARIADLEQASGRGPPRRQVPRGTGTSSRGHGPCAPASCLLDPGSVLRRGRPHRLCTRWTSRPEEEVVGRVGAQCSLEVLGC